MIDFKSDGTAFGGTITDLGNTNVAVSGNVYRLANPVLDTPSVTLAARVGDDSPSAPISVTNSSPDAFTEGLKAGLGAASAGFTASGAIANLAAGSTGGASLAVGLSTETSGMFSGNQGMGFISTGAGTDGAPDLVLPGGSVALTGKVYAPAVASVAPNPVGVGIVHVGDVIVQQALTLCNTASGALTLACVAAGSSDSTSLKVGLSTATAGVFTGTADLAFKSHDPDLADIAVATGPVSLSAQVNNFANAAFLKQSGSGAFAGGGLSYTLNFGNVTKGSAPLSTTLGVMNDVTGPADLLVGLFSVTGGGFSLTGFNPFAGLIAGASVGGLDVLLDPINVGLIHALVTLTPTDSNASGFSGALPDVTLDLVANVTRGGNVPEPPALVLLVTGLIGLAGYRARRRR